MKTKLLAIASVLALSIMLVSGGTVFAASASIEVSDINGNQGDVVEVPINVTEASNIGSLDIVLSYDPDVLIAQDVSRGELTSNSLLQSNTDNPGIIAIGIADSDGINGEGSIAIISFDVLGQSGDSSPLTIESVDANDANTFVDIPITPANGSFIVGDEVEEEGTVEEEAVTQNGDEEETSTDGATGGVTLSPWLIAIIAVVVIVLVVVLLVALRSKKSR